MPFALVSPWNAGYLRIVAEKNACGRGGAIIHARLARARAGDEFVSLLRKLYRPMC